MPMVTAQGISSLAVELLVGSVVLPRTVARVPGTEFSGPNGGTITVRVRLPRTAKTQANPKDPISYDNINETSVDVTVNHLYDATELSDEELTLELENFGRQVLEPMAGAIAIGAEEQIASVMNGLTADILDVTAGNVEESILDAREQLTSARVPLANRWLAVSPSFATLVLGLENLSDASAAGTPSALRDAVIGRYRGFNVVETPEITDGEAVAYHQSGWVWGNRAPAVPNGAADASASTSQGVALRALRDFNPDILSDVVVLSTFAGAAQVDSDRAVKLTTASA